MPSGWILTSLISLSKTITKGTTPRGGNVAYLSSGIGFLRAENVIGFNSLDLNDLKFISTEVHNGYLKRSILEENDVLITIAGTLGRTGIVPKENLPLNANQAISIVRIVNTNDINLIFLIYMLNTPQIQKRFTEQKKITAIPNLTLEIISNCIIPIAPFKEQNRIVKKIQRLFDQI